jgi:hypothetical protein
LQEAFERLKNKFAESIHLAQPDETLPYTVNTDASSKAVAGIFMQTNSNGETYTLSTASRVLTQTERRYSVAEQELLAIVFALDTFRIYIFGHEVYLNTDNNALSFLGKCALTSNCIAGWVMQIQEYNLHISHISGSNKFLADTISRNPAGLTKHDKGERPKPKGIMVAARNLSIDDSVGSLKDLAKCQAQDKRIHEVIQTVKLTPEAASRNYMVQDDILYSKDSHNYPYWRPVLPTDIEIPVMT